MVGFILIVACLSGCVARYSMFKEYADCETVYLNGTEAEARNALIAFLSNAEKNMETMLKDPDSVPPNERMNYSLVLGDSWLRLATIYRFEHDSGNYDRAMARAIHYYDNVKVPDMASNPRYTTNKEASLLDSLEQLEAVNRPKWRTKKRQP